MRRCPALTVDAVALEVRKIARADESPEANPPSPRPRRGELRRCGADEVVGGFPSASGIGRNRERGLVPTAVRLRRVVREVTMDTDPDTLAALLHGGLAVAGALETGRLVVDGPLYLVERFLGLFPLPEPAALADRD